MLFQKILLSLLLVLVYLHGTSVAVKSLVRVDGFNEKVNCYESFSSLIPSNI